MVYQDVTRNRNISAAAKGLYAYLSSFCGVSDECYPSVETITEEMGMGKDTYYRHINALVAAGVVEKHQTTGECGKFGRTIYRLKHEVVISDFPNTKNKDTDKPEPEHRETNSNNIINSNNINNNSKKNICPELENPAPDQSGILLPLSDKTDYNVPLSKIQKWTEAYPAVDVKQELRKMVVWLVANPQRKKTRRGVDRFINSWLSREQDRGGVFRNNGSRQQDPEEEKRRKQQEESENFYNNLYARYRREPSPDDPFQ